MFVCEYHVFTDDWSWRWLSKYIYSSNLFAAREAICDRWRVLFFYFGGWFLKVCQTNYFLFSFVFCYPTWRSLPKTTRRSQWMWLSLISGNRCLRRLRGFLRRTWFFWCFTHGCRINRTMEKSCCLSLKNRGKNDNNVLSNMLPELLQQNTYVLSVKAIRDQKLLSNNTKGITFESIITKAKCTQDRPYTPETRMAAIKQW